MPQGRHRGEAVRRPLPVPSVRRLSRDVRFPAASVSVAAALLGAAAVVAATWPNMQSSDATDVLTASIAQQSTTPANNAFRAAAEARAEERTSRHRSARATATALGATRIGTPQVGAGPGRAPAAFGGVSHAPCPISSSVQSHLTANATAVYLAVCAEFGHTVSSFGGYRAGSPGDHGTGRAVDIMVSGDPGLAIARFVQAHAAALHVTYVIYQQKIWMAGDPTSQWKAMADRGSRTANHYDHVHVSVS